ncbi:hypothetical protein EVAR_85965_1 [Eumeta japonica]|uniref:Uncharacterized protein n=1 Tax=Eumeta variegata TaxID=151549 RepID=A0A4C1UJ10_EUMVA|nr:hypothetical protein EVAR_85965_1 [Eumeta japonica]
MADRPVVLVNGCRATGIRAAITKKNSVKNDKQLKFNKVNDLLTVRVTEKWLQNSTATIDDPPILRRRQESLTEERLPADFGIFLSWPVPEKSEKVSKPLGHEVLEGEDLAVRGIHQIKAPAKTF